jgi:hypothetical protein
MSNTNQSTGPKTPEGKARSAQNAITHGLNAAFAILPQENAAAFDKLVATYRSDFKPATEHETFLIQLMAQSRWRLERIQRLEGLAFDQILGDSGDPNDPDAKILAKMTGRGDPLAVLHRYAGAAERSYHRAHRELMQARKDEKRNEPVPAPAEPEPADETKPDPILEELRARAEYHNIVTDEGGKIVGSRFVFDPLPEKS